LKAEKLIVFKSLEQLSASPRTRVALAVRRRTGKAVFSNVSSIGSKLDSNLALGKYPILGGKYFPR
jgi:hypothetical protein